MRADFAFHVENEAGRLDVHTAEPDDSPIPYAGIVPVSIMRYRRWTLTPSACQAVAVPHPLAGLRLA